MPADSSTLQPISGPLRPHNGVMDLDEGEFAFNCQVSNKL